MLIPYIKLSVSVTSISHHALPKSGELDIALVYYVYFKDCPGRGAKLGYLLIFSL